MKFIKLLLLFFIVGSIGYAQEPGSGKFSGYMFLDYFYNIQRDPGIDTIQNKTQFGEKDLNGFEFRRIYFTYDYAISEQFDTRFRLESTSLIVEKQVISSVFIKDAYLKWNDIFEGSDFIAGIQPTPAFNVSEDYYGYRSLQKTILDLRKVVSSRDIGASLKGKIDDKGVVNYWLMVGNGKALLNETDTYKRVYAHIDLKPNANLRITLYGDINFRPEIESPIMTASSIQMLNNNAYTTDFFIGYQEKGIFSVGVEGFLEINQNDVVSNSAANPEVINRNVLGISLFGSYRLSEMFEAMGRYDYYDDNTDAGFAGDSRNYFLFGLNFMPHKNVRIIPNIEVETFENVSDALQYTSSVTGRLTFYYSFN